MAISFTRPDPSSPSSVASAAFTTSRKGFEQSEVREFLRMVAAELARLQERERFLERELRTAQRSTSPSSIALDDELVTKMLGEEAARILHTARDAASQIKTRAEEGAARLLREATDEAQRLREEAEIEASRRRQDAAADAESELDMAKQQGRDMVNEARAYRERVLNELARRREIARQQIEQLVHGRDRLLQAFERSRLVAVDVMAELTPLGEPNEYVDLSPTTGPVPLMVPNMPRPGTAAAAPAETAPAGTAPAVVEPAVVEPAVEPADVDATVVLYDVVLEDSSPAEDEIVEVDAADEIDAVAEIDDVITEPVDADEIDHPVTGSRDTVVQLDIDHAVHHPVDDDREPAPVVALFAETAAEEPVVEVPAVEEPVVDEPVVDEPAPIVTLELVTETDAETDATVALGRSSADDLFARLRAARAESVAQRAAEPNDDTAPVAVAPVEDSVFASTPDAPPVAVEVDDTPFARRDEALTPLIVAAARKLKRVLADEQNEVLHALRRKDPVRSLEVMVPTEAEQSRRYADAVAGELSAAAVAGAMSMGATTAAAQRETKKSDAVRTASDLLVTEIVQPLRDRLARCVADADGDNDELASLVRLAYREWKSQRIDEHLDDVARSAFGHGALAGVAPGARICWMVDPHGPQCPDAEDNALAGVVGAGEAFPTDHRCAPAHSGCRCMIALADS